MIQATGFSRAHNRTANRLQVTTTPTASEPESCEMLVLNCSSRAMLSRFPECHCEVVFEGFDEIVEGRAVACLDEGLDGHAGQEVVVAQLFDGLGA